MDYTTATLAGVVQRLRPPTTFWLNLCFGRQVNFETQYIDFDLIDKDRRLAPFVSPMAQGRVMTKQGFVSRRFAPAYVKPKDEVNPNHVITRMAGEAYNGELSQESRRNAIIADLLQGQKDKIWRRWEWMAAQAIINGSVTVEGDDYPTQNVDFQRDANQTIALTGSSAWGQTGVSIVDSLDTWNKQTQELSTYFPNTLVVGTDAWAVMKADSEIIELLNKNYRNGDSANLNLGPQSGEIAQYMGKIGVQDVWVYNDNYEDSTGATVPFMDSKTVVGLNPAGVQGIRCFGAIMDKRAGYRAMDIFSKMWDQEDPSVEYLMSQSAPLMVPMEPDAVWSASVIE